MKILDNIPFTSKKSASVTNSYSNCVNEFEKHCTAAIFLIIRRKIINQMFPMCETHIMSQHMCTCHVVIHQV